MAVTKEKFPAQWALDLLEPTPLDRWSPITTYYFIPITMTIFTTGVIGCNMITKRPVLANKPYIVLGGISGFVVGYMAHWLANVLYARKDAMMRDYIMRHPERFPEPSNRKYADIFDKWIPIR